MSVIECLNSVTDRTLPFLCAEQMERFYKVVILGCSGAGLSCIEPVAYRQRFLSRMQELVAPGDNCEA